jgi:hypothetical protein
MDCICCTRYSLLVVFKFATLKWHTRNNTSTDISVFVLTNIKLIMNTKYTTLCAFRNM